jgi:hypothetical protein
MRSLSEGVPKGIHFDIPFRESFRAMGFLKSRKESTTLV